MLLGRIGNAVGWRCNHLFGKAAGQRSMVPWSVLWPEVTNRREMQFEAPEFKVVEEDVEGAQTCYQYGDRYVWQPSGVYTGALPQIFKEVFNPGHPHYYEYLGCELRAGDVVLDGGACEGFFTQFALERGCKVICIEPWSRMAESLRRTFSREIAEGRVVVDRTLIGDREAETTLTLHPKFPSAAYEGNSDNSEFISEPVPVTTIDNIIARSPWKRCDFLKMDIEGHERGALKTAMETIRRDKPRVSIAVYHLASGYVDICADLQSLGLGYQVAGKGLKQEDGRVWRPMMLHAWTSA